MEIVETIGAMQQLARKWLREGHTIAVVPTMGALHAGHVSLVDLACERATKVVATIFVNPTQFGPNEDFDGYPRDEAADLQKLREHKATAVFMPSTTEMYAQGFETKVELSRLPRHLCGMRREGHFAGVTTVVLKLFNAVQPTVAVFGEKDYQQLMIVRKMVRDLNLPVDIVAGPTVREEDGLAMSSRNRYLDPKERKAAASVYQALTRARQLVNSGTVDTIILRKAMTEIIEQAGATVDYVAVIDPESLEELNIVGERAHAALAVFIGRTRLIDNIRLKDQTHRAG
jgi:pantoate--beta-alanine ligase